jgi:non-specific serine/threonine protein kinase/serine/threonine-protein kinase
MQTEVEDAWIGQAIGPYRLISLLGEGGMGAVYLGERESEFRQRVAVKLVRSGISSPEVMRRFVIERHTMAALNHPNIVKLLDAGTTADKHPYLVVGYVDGVPIDKYCDEKHLSTADRLRIFEKVCEAVHFAHQNLVIHCDLKPGNILVTKTGEPMLLDFGIAKLVDPTSFGIAPSMAQTRQRAFTMEYASPEQLRGTAVTTSTDIYALGVILYRLLAGRSPYHNPDSESMEDWIHSICEEEADLPSTAERTLRGDLDAIVLKALNKDPQQRYASAGQFAEDIRAHLEGRPVLAQRHTTAYVLRKYVARHKLAVGSAAAVILCLVAGIAMTMHEYFIASRRFEEVRQLAHVFLFDVHDSIRDLPGSTPALSLIAKTGTDYLNRLSRDASGNTGLQKELVSGYIKIGDVQGNPFESNLGHSKEAVESYRNALAMAQKVVAKEPGSMEANRLLASSHRALAAILPFNGQLPEALQHADAALQLYRRIAAENPRDSQAKVDLCSAHETRGDVLGGTQGANLGRTSEAVAEYQQEIALAPDLPASDPLAQRAARMHAVAITKISDTQIYHGDTKSALAGYEKAMALLEGPAGGTAVKRTRTAISVLIDKIGFAYMTLSENQKALEAYKRGAEMGEEDLKADPSNQRARMGMIVSRKNMGDLLFYNIGDMPAALACFKEAADLLEIEMKADPANLVWKQRLSETLTYVASTLLRLKQPAEARVQAKRGVEMAKEIADRPGSNQSQNYNYAWLAVTVEPEDLQEPAKALPYAKKAVEMSGGRDPFSLHVLAQAYAGMGDNATAVQTEERALSTMPAPQPGQTVPAIQATIQEAMADYRKRLNGVVQK